MSRNLLPPDDSWESDSVWNLLDQAPPKTAGARFADDMVRMARLSEPEKPWWSRVFAPTPLAGFAAGVAAVTFGVIALVSPSQQGGPSLAGVDSPQAVAIQDIAETETLIAAADHLDDFSDNELVSLIGF